MTPDTADLTEEQARALRAADRILNASDLARRLPGAQMQDYASFDEVHVAWADPDPDSGGLGWGAVSFGPDGTYRVTAEGLPRHAIEALLDALAAGQSGGPS